MSVRFLNNNASNNTDVVSKTFPSKELTLWVRNPSWPACEANSGDNRVRGLYAVWPDGANFIAMTVSAAYTVDYGDGTTTNYTSGTTAYYEYTYSDTDLVGTEAPVTFTDSGDLVTRTAHGYSNDMQVQFFNITSTTGISNGQFYYVINATANTFQVSATAGGTAVALTTDGTGQLLPYRIATVTITPQAANNLTSINLFVKHNQSGLADGYSTGWLDLAYAASTITSLTIGNSTTTVRLNNLERVRLNQLGSITSFSNLFQNLFLLQNLEIASTITTITNMTLMFGTCVSLKTVPLFNTASVTDMSSMFSGCSSLQEVPLLNTASVTTMSSMFGTCTSLQTVPLFNTILVNTMSSMFSSCFSLFTVPLFNTVAVTNMSSMFATCVSLKTVPLLNTAIVTNMSTMFSSCVSLKNIPLFNTVAVTNMGSMFSGCNSLTSIPALITTAVTSLSNFSNIFSTCNSLARIEAKNFRFTFSVASCKLSATSLDEIYTNLPIAVSQTITVTGNYGTATDNPAIATAKGWTVTG